MRACAACSSCNTSRSPPLAPEWALAGGGAGRWIFSKAIFSRMTFSWLSLRVFERLFLPELRTTRAAMFVAVGTQFAFAEINRAEAAAFVTAEFFTLAGFRLHGFTI